MDLQPLLLGTLISLGGCLVGGVLNLVISRLPVKIEQEWAEQCQALMGPMKESPGGPINRVRSYLVMALSISATAFSYFSFGTSLASLGVVVLFWTLIALAFIDIETQLLPDAITQPLLWLGLLFNLNGLFVDIQSAVLGAIAGYLALWLIFWGYKLATGRDGFGYGDFKLLAALGAWLGWQQIPILVLFASVVAVLITAVPILLGRRNKQTTIPFGPYLAFSGIAQVISYRFNFDPYWLLAT